MDKGAWWATVYGVPELNPTEQLTHTQNRNCGCLPMLMTFVSVV